MVVHARRTHAALAIAVVAGSLDHAAAQSSRVVTVPDGPPSAGVSTIARAPFIDMTAGPSHHATMGISAQAGNASMEQLRAKLGPSVTYDLYSGALTIPANATPHAAGGVSIYSGILDNFAAGVAGVGSSIISVCETSNCSVWGQNLVVKDVPANEATGNTKQALNGEEIDIRAYNGSHKAIHGIDLQAHLFQPPNGVATGFACLAVQYPWDNCLVSADNAAVTGLYLGAMQRVPQSLTEGRAFRSPLEPSQFIRFGFTYQQLNPKTGKPQEGAGTLQVLPEAGAAQASVLQYRTFADKPAHFMTDAIEVGGRVENLRGDGTINAEGGYFVHGSAGVSCKGPPSADFTVQNGIVTHC